MSGYNPFFMPQARTFVQLTLSGRARRARWSGAKNSPALSGPLKTAFGSGEAANVWEIAGLKRSELRNAAALAALWSPNLFPQTAPMFLGAFLDRLPLLGVSLTAEELTAGFAVRTEEHPLGDLGNRVDISVETRETLLMIEVKIDAPEGPGQVSRYSDVLNAKARLLGKREGLILLSPRPAKTGVAAHASWADVIAAAHSVTRERKAADRTFADHLLRQFAEHISLF